jgi:L,D-transpeptidase YcbB
MFYLKQNSKSVLFRAKIILVGHLLLLNSAYADPNNQIKTPPQNLAQAFPTIDPAPVIFDIPSHGLSATDALRTSKVQQIKIISVQPTSPQIEPINNPFSVLLYQALNAKAASKHSLDEAIKSFYEARAYTPLWLDESGYNSQAKAIKTVLENAATQGLKPSSYKAQETSNNRVEAEISITTAAIRYARDARGARLNPRLISRLITAEPTIPQTHEILAALSTASDAAKILEEFNPQHAGYKALKSKLNEFQLSLQSDPKKQGDIIANMERWRWLPRDLGASYILVNIPEYQLRMVRNGFEVLQTRVIVGKTETPTPIFSGDMDHLIVNPYWNIPPSIALKEMLPKLQSDPYALQQKGFEIVKRGRVVDPATIDWSAGVKNITIRQPPGERNALGFIKFMFPNDHAVYLHDTPSRGLFSNSERAFSHGCIRVQNPFKLAEMVLKLEHGISEHRLQSMAGGQERYFNLQTKLPVHLSYFTSFVDDYGQLQSRPDIYGLSKRVRVALGL